MSKPLQQRVWTWLVTAFGGKFLSPQDRVLRALEEAVELAQAADILQEVAYAMVEHVYSRPKGDPRQELAGLVNTTLMVAEAYGLDGLEAGRDELIDAWERIDVIRLKQAEKVML